MTKPRVFIGSSVEGLNIAYAVQQNLRHQAEATVWDQGVFELSRTTMESLEKTLSQSDFAIFVFSPDDLARIRKETTPVVRDNVLFEFGLFIGKLGRERVFFLLPSDGELHLPSDLLGLTPGRYETKRSDESMQAATGPACQEIRQRVKSIGPIPGRGSIIGSNDGAMEDGAVSQHWITDILEKRFSNAKTTLLNQLETEEGDDALDSRCFIKYCDLKEKDEFTVEEMREFAKLHPDSSRLQCTVSLVLRHEGFINEAIKVLTAAKERNPKDHVIAIGLSACYVDDADEERAIQELLNVEPDGEPDVALKLAELYVGADKNVDALSIVQRSHTKNPLHKGLRYKYARIAQDLGMQQVALCLLDGLTQEDPKSIEYWGYLGNSCVNLEMLDTALVAYQKAERLMKVDQDSQWIVSNIGNVYRNKGLWTEASRYLEQSLKYEKGSQYAHDKLSGTLKEKAEERKDYVKKCNEGKRQIREAAKAHVTAKIEPNLTLVSPGCMTQ